MFLRLLPLAFGSPFAVLRLYFVASTTRSRSPAMHSPTMRSLMPSMYLLAVSTKLPPRAR
jgi:hypothetical protein